MDKYGEDTKLIFNLENQGGDAYSLRYDMTVPFARYVASKKIANYKRFTIGNVYRRDNPSKGRLREFTQADIDITGVFKGMKLIYEAEIIKAADSILGGIRRCFSPYKVELGNYRIKYNDRRIIWGMLDLLEIGDENKMPICSTIDKFDKLNEEEFLAELESKGMRKKKELLNLLKEDGNEALRQLEAMASGKENERMAAMREAIGDLEELRKLQVIFGVETVKFDLTLARGLTYYTGMIIEAVFEDAEVGSVAGGGRYDKLVYELSGFDTPCIGFSIGVTRVMHAVMAQSKTSELERLIETSVLVGSAFGDMFEKKMELLSRIRQEFSACVVPGTNLDFRGQIEYGRKKNYKLVVLTGEKEAEVGKVVVYDIGSNKKSEIDERDLMDVLRDTLGNKN
ncbi:SYHC [Enterospora canceri]|uniref:histidine--tRNA ligase n=1 Tax=Enterospora canceri TaxID=1081671 RepID=A0A1Y1S5H7_9MICR|nr:SYHC [Enterospora canceri]